MQDRDFQPFGSVSALTLGGGGLGQVWGETTREQKMGLEFSKDQYIEIDNYCKKKNIMWSVTAFFREKAKKYKIDF